MYDARYDLNLFQLPSAVRAHNEGPSMNQYYTSLGVASRPEGSDKNGSFGIIDIALIGGLLAAAFALSIYERRGRKKAETKEEK
ncbi:hypothetical protein J4209_06550 [Candidatus Woesearchaeota archaeon]|nr:hypothetical protein [Candidatus Woesearchaeota archaeon]